MQNAGDVSEDQDMKEEESARNDLAFSKSFLGSIAALLCNVFDARGGAIMVVIKMMQGSEVSNEAQISWRVHVERHRAR